MSPPRIFAIAIAAGILPALVALALGYGRVVAGASFLVSALLTGAALALARAQPLTRWRNPAPALLVGGVAIMLIPMWQIATGTAELQDVIDLLPAALLVGLAFVAARYVRS